MVKSELDSYDLHPGPEMDRLKAKAARRRELYRAKKNPTRSGGSVQSSGVCRSCNTLRPLSGACEC